MHIFFHPNKRIYNFIPVITELKGHKLYWTHEDPYESDITFDMAQHFYYMFTSDENTANQLKKEFPGNSINYVPHACNPKVHKPQEVSYEYRSDICFVGNAYESRLKYLSENKDKFNDKMVTLIGVGYRGLDGYQNQRVIHGHVSEEEMDKYLNGAKLVLNIHRLNTDLDMANKRGLEPKHLNNRFYEVSAMNKTQLVENRDDMKDEIERVGKMKPEEYSYKSRLIKYYLNLLK
jgi:spore maturation protein CgeB